MPLPSDTYMPTTADVLASEIARVRHGDDCTATDLTERLMPWLTARDASVAAKAWDEGARFVLDTGWVDGDDAPPNPYRARLSSGGEG